MSAINIAVCTQPSRPGQLGPAELSNLQPQLGMMAFHQLLDSLAAVAYWEAGVCTGLLQGYAYAAAEVAEALGLTEAERRLRRWTPAQRVSQQP